jgi:hypothetical protein
MREEHLRVALIHRTGSRVGDQTTSGQRRHQQLTAAR